MISSQNLFNAFITFLPFLVKKLNTVFPQNYEFEPKIFFFENCNFLPLSHPFPDAHALELQRLFYSDFRKKRKNIWPENLLNILYE